MFLVHNVNLYHKDAKVCYFVRERYLHYAYLSFVRFSVDMSTSTRDVVLYERKGEISGA